MRRMLMAAALGGILPLSGALAQVQVTISPDQRRQVIEGLGATATGFWHDTVVEAFRQPSFIERIRDLGASIVRFEMHPEVQANEDLDPAVIDWQRFDFDAVRHAGAFVRALTDGNPGRVKVIASVWSPPAWMKSNGSTLKGGTLRADRRPHFGKFCAAAALGFERTYGVPLYAISPQNEPVFAEPYASCVYDAAQYREMIRAVEAAFRQFNVGAKVFGPEDVGTSPPRWTGFVQELGTDPVALGRVDMLAIHGFPWTNNENVSSGPAWESLRQCVAAHGKPLWVSETSGQAPQWLGTATNPNGALALAKQIHDAIVHGEATAFVYWSFTDPVASDFALMELGTPTKKFHAARHFYRFIRPGAVRLAASSASPEVLASAFVHDTDRTTTIVLVNLASEPREVRVSLGGGNTVARFATVRTSATEDSVELPETAVQAGRASLTLPAHSVVTLQGAGCYAKRGHSSSAPVLSIADFTCFLQRFAAMAEYANCDQSTASPVLNVADFTCFLQQFAAGCL